MLEKATMHSRCSFTATGGYVCQGTAEGFASEPESEIKPQVCTVEGQFMRGNKDVNKGFKPIKNTYSLMQINNIVSGGWDRINLRASCTPAPAPKPTQPVCKTTPLVVGGCVTACQGAYGPGAWANGDNKVNIGNPGNGGICSCTLPTGCRLPPNFTP